MNILNEQTLFKSHILFDQIIENYYFIYAIENIKTEGKYTLFF